jgi:hypothetical protein
MYHRNNYDEQLEAVRTFKHRLHQDELRRNEIRRFIATFCSLVWSFHL